jgi:ElaB/YqjD/DUF883 family membrane-anchored ribosome-binding protein
VKGEEQNMRMISLIVALVTTAVLPVLGQEGVGQEIKHDAKKAGETIKDGLETVGDKTKETAKAVGKKTKQAAQAIGEKTRETGETVATKTRETVEGTGEKAETRKPHHKGTKSSNGTEAQPAEEQPKNREANTPAPSPQ